MGRRERVEKRGLSKVVANFSRQVASLSNEAVKKFNDFYNGKAEKIKKGGEIVNYNTIKDILNVTEEPYARVISLIKMIERIYDAVERANRKLEGFERSEEKNAKFEEYKRKHLLTILDASLMIKEALDKNILPDSLEKNIALKIVKKYLTWDCDEIFSEKLNFEEVNNTALFQQLLGEIPISPIADSIMPFSLLEWQSQMFMALRNGKNVIVSAPTSSGKTMVALGYIISFLKNEKKSLLVYIVPNNVLAIEISAILNKYVEGLVSTILDKDEDRRVNERVIVCTPSGAINTKFVGVDLPDNSLLVVDEIQAIGNKGGSEMEYCLREMSFVQTLVLSATMTERTMERISGMIDNEGEIEMINEKTQFMVQQDMYFKDGSLRNINKLAGVDLTEENLDIQMTPKDVLMLFMRIIKNYGVDKVPAYLAPIRFFCLHNCRIPDSDETIEQNLEKEEEDSGHIRRLTMEDINKWKDALINFMNKEVITENQEGSELNYDNAFRVLEEMKEKEMFPALFFFKNLYNAIQYGCNIVKKLGDKTVDDTVERREGKMKKSKVKSLEKRIGSLERARGNGRLLRDKRERLKMELDKEDFGEYVAVHKDRCLSSNGGITQESFVKYVEMLKRWNKKFTQSHSIAQMVLYGVGILSGDMPEELQIFIRQLYMTNIIVVLMTTKDCAYGINTPTKSVILGSGLSEVDRRQMKGRAGRKGLGYKAYTITFGKVDGDSILNDLEGETVELYNEEEDYSEWISRIAVKNSHFVVDRNEDIYERGKFRLGLAGNIGWKVIHIVMDECTGEVNLGIKMILSVLPLLGECPFREKEGWNYELPKKLIRFYELNGMQVVVNNLVYDWLMNRLDDISSIEREELVEKGKDIMYFFYLVKGEFDLYLEGKNVFEEIMNLIMQSIILTSSVSNF